MARANEVVSNTASSTASVGIYEKQKLVYSTLLNRELRLGRQHSDEPAPYARSSDRVIIACREESAISRRQLRIAARSSGKVLVTNTSNVNPIFVGKGEAIEPGASLEVTIPTCIRCGTQLDREIRVELPEETDGQSMESIGHQLLAPGQATATMLSISKMLEAESQSESTQLLLRGLQSTVGFFQLAASSDDFLTMAADMMVDLIGVDTAAALTYQDGDWSVQALRVRSDSGPSDSRSWAPSQRILESIASERATFWQLPTSNAQTSLDRVEALIAAPILNRKAEVIGALYGDRRLDITSSRDFTRITEIEAIVIELLATSVAAAFARLEHQEEATQARILFEQFFTPQLSRQLQSEPALLNGKDAEVTLLCCNIRGFSRVSERLGARLTIDWVNDVMGTLSGCISSHDGVLVDTLGDELIGMWGAPVENVDHARLATQAAIDMLGELPALNNRWRSALDKAIEVGAAIHTGVARVGNIGSEHKLKYGPLGNTVTIVRKLASMTKQFRSELMTTSATLSHLDKDSPTRQLGHLDDEEAGEPIAFYELATEVSDAWAELKRFYEAALKSYQRNDLTTATKMLGRILAKHPNDYPSRQLLAKIVAMSR